ncbi:multidrug efflux SMR transporter [bacterium]|jgi:quaternary ammonium compound-resistance protein SugE|nr:multidrug efflux SMR transporter [bacterium]
MGWLFIIAAGIFEIGFTSFLKLSEGFTRPLPSIGFLVFGAISFYLLTLGMKSIPLGSAYAVWTGIGAFGTAIMGMIFFGDPVTAWRLFFLLTLVGSIIGLKMVSAH